MDLISLASPVSSSYTGSNLSEEVPTAGGSAQEGSDS